MYPHIMKFGIWEEVESYFLRTKINSGSNVINIGANIGYHSLSISNIIGNKGKLLAIEPNPDLREILRNNMRKSRYKNYKIIEAALGGKGNYTYLYKNNWNFGDSRIFDSSNFTSNVPDEHKGLSVQNRVKVKNTSLRKLSQQFSGRIDFILSDAQGMDIQILLQDYSVITTYKPMILFEFVPSWSLKLRQDINLVFEKLRNDNYSIFELSSKGLIPFTKEKSDDENFGIEAWYANILCVQNDKI